MKLELASGSPMKTRYPWTWNHEKWWMPLMPLLSVRWFLRTSVAPLRATNNGLSIGYAPSQINTLDIVVMMMTYLQTNSIPVIRTPYSSEEGGSSLVIHTPSTRSGSPNTVCAGEPSLTPCHRSHHWHIWKLRRAYFTTERYRSSVDIPKKHIATAD